MKNELTVVIPTLCKSEQILAYTLNELNEAESVKEILVFDNTLGQFKSSLNKVKIYNTENLYVNPAWNKGVELCTTPYYLLLNDDIMCDRYAVNAATQLLSENKSIGLTTIATNDIEQKDFDFYSKINNPEEEPDFIFQGDKSDGWYYYGWFICSRKDLWTPIDNNLKIFYGDNLIYLSMRHYKKKMAFITNYNIYHALSTTCKALGKYSDNTLSEERPYYEIALKNLYNDEKVEPKKLSACLIVKNEESNLDRCLSSIKNIVDEIIIVDTGSTDKTKEIAIKYTDKIYDFTWNDSFADARNYSVSKATGDWIIVLDADEELEKGKREDFDKLINISMDKPINYQVRIKNIIYKDKNEELEHFMCRLFPKSPDIFFEGVIHEYLKHTKNDMISVLTENIVIRHHGYEKSLPNSEAKLQRNIDLLKKLENTQDDKTLAYYHSAVTYIAAKKFDLALEYLDKWKKEALKQKHDLALGFSLYLICYIQLKEYQKALDAVRDFIPRCIHSADFCLNLGAVYEELGYDDKALDILEKATKCSSLNSLVQDVNSTTWKPYALIGNIRFKNHEYTKALEAWEKCFDYTQSEDIIQAIIGASFELRDIERCSKYLDIMENKYPKNKNEINTVLKGNLLFNKGKIKESIECFLSLKDGRTYIDQIISGCISMNRFDDVEIIKEVLNVPNS